jgi:tRNA (cytidine32/uridine32-2'-O)-methyltransferase
LLQNIRVVLVNTSHPGNIGGAARAMKNMGLSRLVLVEPRLFPHHEADARASGAGDILENAQVVATLEDALVGCNLVLGTSARDRAFLAAARSARMRPKWWRRLRRAPRSPWCSVVKTPA